VLWTGESWSNGSILYSLCSARFLPKGSAALLSKKAVKWFGTKQKPDGNWEDVEDTAWAILGQLALSRRARQEEHDRGDWRTELRGHVSAPGLILKRGFVERQPDGYMTVNLSPALLKWLGRGVAILAVISGIVTIVGFLLRK
jgi:hypothetical protein